MFLIDLSINVSREQSIDLIKDLTVLSIVFEDSEHWLWIKIVNQFEPETKCLSITIECNRMRNSSKCVWIIVIDRFWHSIINRTVASWQSPREWNGAIPNETGMFASLRPTTTITTTKATTATRWDKRQQRTPQAKVKVKQRQRERDRERYRGVKEKRSTKCIIDLNTSIAGVQRLDCRKRGGARGQRVKVN